MEPPRIEPTNTYGLLDAVKEAITVEPARIRMDGVIYSPQGLLRVIQEGYHTRKPDCNTVGCIYGWMLVLSRKPEGKILQEPDGWEAFNSLFGSQVCQIKEWKEDEFDCDVYRLCYTNFPVEQSGTPEYAKTICDRITKFQEKWEDRLKSHPVMVHE